MIGFCDRIWFHEKAGLGEPAPDWWLGVSKYVGGKMCLYVLSKSGRVLPRSSVWKTTNLELQTKAVKHVFHNFDRTRMEIIKDENFPVDEDKPDPDMWADLADNDEDF